MRTIVLFLLMVPNYILGQTDYWKSIILEGDEFKYLVPEEPMNENWMTKEFNDSEWNTGASGFGYGDNDDNTFLPGIQSVFLRKKFDIIDIGVIKRMIFHMDFDDGYVAYINGIEISRQFMTGNPPEFNQRSDGFHEASLYQGMIPENEIIDVEVLNEGENVLAVQVHNENINSSDLTAIPFLSVELSSGSSHYRPTPEWFQPPITFNGSHLPVIIINTNGQAIVDDPKINAAIGIIYNGEGKYNNINDSFDEYHGKCGIEIRGESTQIFDKKSYLFEFWDEEGNDMDTSFLNFPAEEDFILYGPYMDKSLINNVLAMKIGREMGQYASRTRFVELVINEEYKGLYVVMEKIKRDENRLDIAKLNSDELSGDDLTGGYIVRLDKGIYDGWNSRYNASGTNKKLFFQYYVPDQNEIQEEQKIYIENYFHQFEMAIASEDYKNDQGKRYSDYINIRSFVDNFIINELSKNVDAYRLSSYFHKDKDSKGGKIVAGPIWDYNFSFGNANYCGGDLINGWIYQQCDHGGIPFWWDKLLQDEFFQNALRCRWENLREDVLATDYIFQTIDSMVLEIGDAAQRNFKKWPTLGSYVWPNPDYFIEPTEHHEIIETMKNRLANRFVWLDLSIPGKAENCAYYEEFDEIISDTDEIISDSEDIRIYPNPTSSFLQIESKNKMLAVEIFNILGTRVFQEKEIFNTLTLNLDHVLSPGSYLIRIKCEEGIVSKIFVFQ